MKTNHFLLLTASLSLAMAFTISCSDDGHGDETQPSSSSNESSVIHGQPVNYQGETYETVVIGEQTWMARNLNYAVEGSKCGDGNALSDANTPTCDTYGRLYNWTTAMSLDVSCNLKSCATDILENHRGICPEGWHIPSNADWDKLYRYADGTSGTESPYRSENAGKYLRAKNGWKNCSDGIAQYKCYDTYGFAALPGSNGNMFGLFFEVGNYGNWWVSNESNIDDDFYLYAYGRRLWNYDYYGAELDVFSKQHLFSVRCLKD
jgi:uncharacterized protein (TIGR02145 family)